MLDLKSSESPLWGRHTLHVPREDQTAIAHPRVETLLDAIENNRSQSCHLDTLIQGRPLRDLQAQMRAAVVEEALNFTGYLTDSTPEIGNWETIIVGGHQPALFHPGVWVKNIAINALAERTSGLAINLVVDNDLMTGTGLRVPKGPVDELTQTSIAFDSEHPQQPWEEATVQDRTLFTSFADRVIAAMQPWDIDPLIAQMWPAAVNHLQKSDNIAECLTAARHSVEEAWGCHNLELPMSRLFQLRPVLWMVYHYLVELPKLHAIHNEVLAEYRAANHVRSKTHPVPELATNGEWLEAPFWIWQAGDQQRRPLWVRSVEHGLELSDGETTLVQLPAGSEAEAERAVEELASLNSRGIRLRPRALSTTLIARMGFADLFVHGIGGAKYDTMTDRIISRFWDCEPPCFMALSGTLQLPLATPFDASAADRSRIQYQIRDLQYNSDRYLSTGADPKIDALISEKQTLIAQQKLAEGPCPDPNCTQSRRDKSRVNRERFLRLKAINSELAKVTESQKIRLEEELRQIDDELNMNGTLQNREFSIALFPADKIQPFMNSVHDTFSSLE